MKTRKTLEEILRPYLEERNNEYHTHLYDFVTEDNALKAMQEAVDQVSPTYMSDEEIEENLTPQQILWRESNKYKKGCASDMPAIWHNIAINCIEFAEKQAIRSLIFKEGKGKGLQYGDKVKCSDYENYKNYWIGTYISKHPTRDAHVVLCCARPELKIQEDLETFTYCQQLEEHNEAIVYSDGKDYSHLEPNSEGFDETAEEGEFNGTCVSCGSENITVTDEADICHNCGHVYT